MVTTPLPKEPFARRIAELRQALKQDMLPSVRLTRSHKVALNRAAALTAWAERIKNEPQASPDDIVRLDNSASRAREAWRQLCAAQREGQEAPLLSVSELLDEAAE